MTISLAAVFIPVLFMGGIIGRLFHEFAVTIGVAILVSGFVSLSLTPMLCSRFLKHSGEERHGRFYQATERVFDAMLQFYARTLAPALGHPGNVLAFSAVILLATVWLFVKIPKGFLPTEDQGLVFGFTEGAQGIGFPAMKEHQQEVAAIVRAHPDVANVLSACGPRGNISVGNSGIVLAQLKPRAERKHSADEIIAELRPKLPRHRHPRVPAGAAPDPAGRQPHQEPVPVHAPGLRHGGALPLRAGARAEDAGAAGTAGRDERPPALKPAVQPHDQSGPGRGARVPPQKIEDALYTAYGTRQISTIYMPNNQYQVIMELAPEFQANPNAINLLYVRSSTGSWRPSPPWRSVQRGTGPLSVTHTGQLPSVTISFNLKPGVALGDAVKAVEKAARGTLPPRSR